MRFKCSCGDEFITTWKQFSSEKLKKRQCNTCGRRNANKSRMYSLEDVRRYAQKYGNVLLSTKYTNVKTPLKFRCECGNEYTTTFDYMKNGNRKKCFVCIDPNGNLFKKGTDTHNKKTHNEFLNELKTLRGNEYEVLTTYKGAHEKIKLKHKCGFVWVTRPDKVLNAFQECPECYDSKNSKLSREIQRHLDKHKINYRKEYWFDDCRNIKPLPFDFAIFQNEKIVLIEADGQQHYEPFRFSDNKQENIDNFKLVQKRDSIKNKYCKDNGIKLIRIPYYKQEEVEGILITNMIIPSQASEGVKKVTGRCND